MASKLTDFLTNVIGIYNCVGGQKCSDPLTYFKPLGKRRAKLLLGTISEKLSKSAIGKGNFSSNINYVLGSNVIFTRKLRYGTSKPIVFINNALSQSLHRVQNVILIVVMYLKVKLVRKKKAQQKKIQGEGVQVSRCGLA